MLPCWLLLLLTLVLVMVRTPYNDHMMQDNVLGLSFHSNTEEIQQTYIIFNVDIDSNIMFLA
jgi:hypothetical protein